MSSSACSWARGERSPTHSRAMIGASPCCIASTTVARTQPEVDAPQTTSVSRPASSAANGTPKKADACAFTSTGSAGRRPSRGSISTHSVPGRSTFRAGALRRKTAAAASPTSSYSIVVKYTGTPARRAASSTRRVATSTSSRSHASGDRGDVNPTLRSTTTTAGRPPTPARPPKSSAIADARERGLAILERRPAQRLGLDRRGQARLLLAVGEHVLQRRAEVERQRVAALGLLALALGRRGLGVADHHAVRAERLLGAHQPVRHISFDRLDRPLQPVLPAAATGGAVDQHVPRLDGDLVALGREHLFAA